MDEVWEYAGLVNVESGNLMIHDIPASEVDQALAKYTKASSERAMGRLENFDATTDGLGVIVNGFGGDGDYPVFIKRDKDGATTEVRIVFTEEAEKGLASP